MCVIFNKSNNNNNSNDDDDDGDELKLAYKTWDTMIDPVSEPFWLLLVTTPNVNIL